MVPHHGLGLAAINSLTKFEFSISTHYEDMKGDTKCGKWGGLGVVKGHSRSLEIAPFLFFCFCAVRYTKLAFLSAFERT